MTWLVWVAWIAATYSITTLFGYVVHWSLHQPWSADAYRRHRSHHDLYPVEDYESDVYRAAGNDSTAMVFAVASLPMLAVPIVLGLLGLSWWIVGMLEAEMLLIGWFSDFAHDRFHIQDHWMKRFAFYRQWNVRHIQHHTDVHSNLGIFGWFGWDRLFGTFKGGI